MRIIHGYRNTPTYSSWINMRQRCENPNDKSYHRYGGRGIKVCARWRRFLKFLKDMGERPPGTTLDRIDVNKSYSKDNCRWATNRTQLRNTRANRMITFKGQTKCLVEWAETINLRPGTLARRLNKGWSIERALTTATVKSQKGVIHNQKLYELNGVSQNLKVWAAQYGIKYATLSKRITSYGMSLSQALTQPVRVLSNK